MNSVLRIRHIVDSPGWALDICHSKFGVSKSRLKYLVHLGSIRVNGEPLWLGDRWVQQGDYLQIHLNPKRYYPKNFGPRVWQWLVYADDDMCIIDKPAGLPVIVTTDNRLECVSGWLRFSRLYEDIPPEFIPEPVPDSLPIDYTTEVPSPNQSSDVKNNIFSSSHSQRIARYPHQFHRARDLVSGQVQITHRMDVGTHGLLMLSRRREFQSYFNILLAKHITRKWYQAIVTTNAWEQFLTKYGFNKNNVEFPIILKHWMAEIREDEDEQISHFIPSYKTIHKGLRPWPPIGTIDILTSDSIPEPRRVSLSSTPTTEHTLLCELHIVSAQPLFNDITDDLLHLTNSPTFTQSTHSYRATPIIKCPNSNDLLSEAKNLKEVGISFEYGLPVPLTQCLPLRPFSLSVLNDLYTKYQTSLTLLTVELITGRTHQIRAQLSQEGLPLFGDWLYQPEQDNEKQENSSLSGLPTSMWCPHQDTFALCCVCLAFPYDESHLIQRPQTQSDSTGTTKGKLKKLRKTLLRQDNSIPWFQIFLPPLPPLKESFPRSEL